MMNADFLEEKLKTLTAEQLACGLGISVNTLRWKIKELGIDVRQIKHDHSIDVLSKLSTKHTIKEMMQITGFSRRKLMLFSKSGHVTFKFSTTKAC